MPKTKLGKFSIRFIVAMPLCFIIGTTFLNTYYDSVLSGATILNDIKARPGVALSMLAGLLSGISAFITGAIAIIRKQERSTLVYASTIIGMLLILFLLAEVVAPH